VSSNGEAVGKPALTQSFPVDNTMISTVAGHPPSGVEAGIEIGDGGPAVDATFSSFETAYVGPDQAIYVADDTGGRVRRFTVGGVITTVAGITNLGFSGDGGLATKAQLNNPGALCIDRNGILFMADGGNARIRAVNPKTHIITTVAGGGANPPSVVAHPAAQAQLTAMLSMRALPFLSANGQFQVLFTDPMRHVICRLMYDSDPRGEPVHATLDTVLGVNGKSGQSPDGTPAATALTVSPTGLDYVNSGTLFFVEGDRKIRSFRLGGSLATTPGVGAAGDEILLGIAIDRARNLLYFSDINHIRRFTLPSGAVEIVAGDGGLVATPLPAPAVSVSLPVPGNPGGLGVLADGSIVVAAAAMHHVLRFTPGGMAENIAGRSETGPVGDGGPAVLATVKQPLPALAVDGTLFFAESGFSRIRRVDRKTGLVSSVLEEPLRIVKGLGGPLSGAMIDNDLWLRHRSGHGPRRGSAAERGGGGRGRYHT